MKKIFFIGIGGIGMSALARYYHKSGWEVFGYDKTETILTKKLVEEGMKIHYVDDISFIERDVELVVYTPAIPDENQELTWYRAHNYKIFKRAEVLGMISRHAKTIAIAGTHGKTTTSSMLSHIMKYNGFDFTGFIGGISIERGSNFVQGNGGWVLMEADEYDRSFLHLEPAVACLMSLDPDHLDIYGDEGGILEGFKEFTYQIKERGRLFLSEDSKSKLGDDWMQKMKRNNVDIILFGDEKDVSINKLRIEDGKQRFAFKYKNWSLDGVEMDMAGRHNVENAAVAMSIALDLGIGENGVYQAMSDFMGIKRRFEFVIRTEDLVMIDDYAHHPTELTAVISATRTMYPEGRILGVFQPHLFSRTQDFYRGFASALDGLDETILLPIYPARELPIEGVGAEIIIDEMKSMEKSIVDKSELIDALKNKKYDVLLILGAGDIGEMVIKIADILK